MPRGSAIVFRAFGAADAAGQGLRLKAIARSRGLKLLVGADARLARGLRADGVHLPERAAHRARRIAIANPRWIVTAAAHSLAAARRAKALGADAAVVSSAFASRSASAGEPLGPLRLAAIARAAGLPVYALGGISNKNARLLKEAGLVGLAGIEGFRT